MGGNPRRRFRTTALFTLVIGIGVVLIVRNLDWGTALPILLVALVGVMVGQYFLLFRGGQPATTAAQDAFIAGDFEAVIRELDGKPNATPEELTLLGNAYRQVGQFDKSLANLRKATEQAPTNPLPLYGLGRTYLAVGEFEQAAHWIDTALSNGGKKSIRAELLLALYLQGADTAQLKPVAVQASQLMRIEPYRGLMVNHILHQLNTDNPMQAELALKLMHNHRDGLAYWEAEIQRYPNTPYGKRLQTEVAMIKERIKP